MMNQNHPDIRSALTKTSGNHGSAGGGKGGGGGGGGCGCGNGNRANGILAFLVIVLSLFSAALVALYVQVIHHPGNAGGVLLSSSDAAADPSRRSMELSKPRLRPKQIFIDGTPVESDSDDKEQQIPPQQHRHPQLRAEDNKKKIKPVVVQDLRHREEEEEEIRHHHRRHDRHRGGGGGGGGGSRRGDRPRRESYPGGDGRDPRRYASKQKVVDESFIKKANEQDGDAQDKDDLDERGKKLYNLVQRQELEQRHEQIHVMENKESEKQQQLQQQQQQQQPVEQKHVSRDGNHHRAHRRKKERNESGDPSKDAEERRHRDDKDDRDDKKDQKLTEKERKKMELLYMLDVFRKEHEQRQSEMTKSQTKEVLRISTGLGTIQIVLQPYLSPESVDYIRALAREGCTKCQFYRAEPTGIFQGVMSREEDGDKHRVPRNKVKGDCPAAFVSLDNRCPRHDVHCGCHGPIMTRGMVGWAGGGTGPHFFVDNYVRPVDWWGTQHTVWGEIQDEESFKVIDKVWSLPASKGGGSMTMLTDPIPFTMKLVKESAPADIRDQ